MIQTSALRIASTLKGMYFLFHFISAHISLEKCDYTLANAEISSSLKHGLIPQNSRQNLDNKAISNVFNSFEEKHTTPFLLHSLGYNCEEIASMLGLPSGVVKSRIFYLKNKMRDLLTESSE